MTQVIIHSRKWILVTICAAVTLVAIGAGGAKIAAQYFVQGPSASQIIFLPGGNEQFDSDIARLDTRTGAIYRFRGNVNNPSVRNTWELRVPPVKETSGWLEVQTIALPPVVKKNESVERPVTAFLVDIVTGKTWILRQRASTNATWDPVDVYRHSNWGTN